eukprot:TRINITY_DN5292_c0_g1_i1.p1 TRINITY_DN5292_c0_g1~~TRINITY_DN5292_c0_g1_i1.p1  ORF type:complete len:325 (-),score=74.61 TRINITY_DN5292_c0_g1_i1:628-1479(-)
MRNVMRPLTASALKESKSNSLKDFLGVAGPLGVSQFIVFSATGRLPTLRLARVPRGPTLTFRIHEFSLSRDIVSLQQRPRAIGAEFHTSPLVVLNNFAQDEKSQQLAAIMLQNMFPPISVAKVKLSDCRRVVLFNHNKDTGHIDFRHYCITVQPSGLSKSIKRVIQARIPDLSKVEDISEYVLGAAEPSESDVEEGDDNRVTIARVSKRKNTSLQTNSVRLCVSLFIYFSLTLRLSCFFREKKNVLLGLTGNGTADDSRNSQDRRGVFRRNCALSSLCQKDES